mmetsp:Transcript_38614/g.114695  ORF Transcript_38614/g.114695 Transcript_38614/m.114695 type:complete len:108 (-) Transcript_38614:444-767(-)
MTPHTDDITWLPSLASAAAITLLLPLAFPEATAVILTPQNLSHCRDSRCMRQAASGTYLGNLLLAHLQPLQRAAHLVEAVTRAQRVRLQVAVGQVQHLLKSVAVFKT